MSLLPDEDQEPLEPPTALIGLWKGSMVDGRQVVAMPAANPRLGPTLDVIGFGGHGWYLRVKDALGTVVWSIMLEGLDDPPTMDA